MVAIPPEVWAMPYEIRFKDGRVWRFTVLYYWHTEYAKLFLEAGIDPARAE